MIAGPLDAVVSWPGRPAVGVTDATRTVASTGDAAAVRPWASVTKLLTALAVLVAVEEGTVTLDQPAGPAGSSVAHLLAHASGLGPDGPEQPVAPGTRRIYSTYAYDVIGDVLGLAAGMTAGEYITAAVLDPLAMTATTATGSPGSGATGPLADLLILGRELLAPTIVDVATLREARQVAWPGLDGVLPGFGRQRPLDWGLGFELRSHKHPHWTGATNSPATFGHFGQSGAFLWVDPVAGIACASVTDTAFGPWAASAWPPFADAVLAAHGRP